MTPSLPAVLAPLVDRVRRLRPRPETVPPIDPGSLSDHPETQPYAGGSGADAVLLCHGFTSTPQSMRPWADHLVAAGFTVSVPQLPGHGTSWQDLNATPWTAWYAEVDAAFTALTARHERVFVVGLSMGGCLALRLAEQHRAAVSGLVLVNPCVNITDPRMRILPVLQRLTPSLAAIGNDIAKPGSVEIAYDRNPLRALYSQSKMWADVRDHLERVDQPLLIFKSDVDHVVDPSSATIITSRISATDVTYVRLARSYHVATLDYEAEQIFDSSVGFFRRLAGVGEE